MFTIRLALLLLFILTGTISIAQDKILENAPPGIEWYQINTPNFDLIFEKNFEEEAQKLANDLEFLYVPVSRTLGEKPKRIPIILQNHNSISNGFVSQSPRRSEIYTMPSQNYNFLGVLDWFDLLTVHEYRHVVQFDKSRTGFNKLVYYLFGYEASASMAHLAVPEWFWEGDAVNIETALTPGGRGRIPNFGLLMRTNTLERGPFDYHRQYLRSFKYKVQDHYVFGHYFTAWLRKKYGEDLIDKVTGETWKWPFLPFRFSGRLKKYTGKSLIDNYDQMIREMDTVWRDQLATREFTTFERVNGRKSEVYTDYLYPHYTEDGNLIALKSGIGDIATFVMIDRQGREKQVFVPGLLNESAMISVEAGKIVWNEYQFDPRYRKKTYSIIKTYDLETNKLNRITRKTRYNSAALSTDGHNIVTVETDTDYDHRLVIIDSEDGRRINELLNPDNCYYVHPRWSDTGNEVVAVKQVKEGKTIMVWDLNKDSVRELWPLSYENVGYPVKSGNLVFYNSPYDGIDNIYVFDLETEKRYRVTSSQYGAYNPQVSEDGKTLIYNDFTSNGHDIVRMELDRSRWMPLDKVKISEEGLTETLVEQEGNTSILESTYKEKYPVNRYHIAGNIIKPYAWGPYITSSDLDFLIGLKSQDIMSTTTMDLGYQLNTTEGTGQWMANITYQGLYPALSVTGYTGTRSTTDRFRFTSDEGNVTNDTTTEITWQESGLAAGFRIPLLLTRSKYHQNLDVGFEYSLNRVTDYSFIARYPNRLGNGDLFSNTYYLSYRRIMKRSKRDLYGKFGQTLHVNYEHTPYGGDYLGGLLGAEVRLFFPGLFKHHALHMRSGFLNQDTGHGDNLYLFSSPLVFTRGYNYLFYDRYWNNSVNYAFPVAYPDFHVGSLLNIQRIYSNVFFDMGTRFLGGDKDYFRSVGAEVSFDFNVMRFLTLFNAGVRYSYAMDRTDQPHRFQLLIGNFGF